ncbi:MAG: hypothetical protein A2934_03880 [Candidatus Sungbacteria bacterium RIFCSPLOWO2_01_FULL_47_10]|uniref:NADH-quinone oxidoreductase subunit K n=1 Tax=Candidatus Sungbacteria bacterium RIFCSPLOWO2_01_FULL_47_10 TaxID=1802276 RepID=A0A1G2L8B0_9BACT|nr:MAG: hypothetical protein A2934_03880 [Candidatus Sungbacteria bacterium RIFCSPLOWO2_01_FULL_47_10]
MFGLIFFGSIIFILGLYGVTTHKDVLRIFVSAEIMIAAANLLLAGFLIQGSAFSNPAESAIVMSQGFVFLFFVWLFTIANAVVGLPLFLLIKNRRQTQNTEDLNQLNG